MLARSHSNALRTHRAAEVKHERLTFSIHARVKIRNKHFLRAIIKQQRRMRVLRRDVAEHLNLRRACGEIECKAPRWICLTEHLLRSDALSHSTHMLARLPALDRCFTAQWKFVIA